MNDKLFHPCKFCKDLINPPNLDAMTLHLVAMNQRRISAWEEQLNGDSKPITLLSGLVPQWYHVVLERYLEANPYHRERQNDVLKIEPNAQVPDYETVILPRPYQAPCITSIANNRRIYRGWVYWEKQDPEDRFLETQTWLTEREKERLPYLRKILGEFVKAVTRHGYFIKGKAINRSSTSCPVCLHKDRYIIESRIRSGDPLHGDEGDGESGILKDYPLPLFYHQKVCLENRSWKEFLQPTNRDNSNRWPVKLRNTWIIELAERYGHFNNVRLGVSRFRSHFVNWRDGFEYEVCMPIYDPSSCLNCRYVCRAIEQLDDSDFGLNAIFNDSIPGLREVIQQRNKRHPLHSSGDSAVGKGRIPNKLVRKTCIIGRKQIHRITRMWYLKQFPAYSESSDEEFREHIAKKMRLKEEDLKFYDREDFNRDFYKNDSLKNKYRDYYKFPIFYTYGWDYDADGNANPLMEHVNKWENFHRLVSFCCQPEEVSSWRILEKRTKTYHDPVYLPNKGEDKHDRGIKERDEFAIIPRDDWKDLNPGGLARVIKKYFTWTAYEKKRLRWKLTRGSVGSYHNERTQAVAIAPLNSKMRETLVKEGSPFYSQSKCDCGGTVRYDEHLALVCDKCSAFYGYKIVTDNFMNMRGEEEESGDDDSWNINELDAEGDENPYTQINYDHTNYRRIKRLTGNLEDERQKKEKEEQRKIEYIRSNSREKKAAFLDYKISILLKQNGDGLEQASLRGMLKEHFNTDVTHSAIKSAINRMEEKGQVKTADMYTRNGKRIFVRLIAKT